jgi:dihydroxyacetone kinase-like protein
MEYVLESAKLLASDKGVLLLVNNYTGDKMAFEMAAELYLLYGIAHQRLAAQGITVGRSYVGEYCTSLDMAGASLTLVRLDDEIRRLLAAPAEVAVRVF